MGKMKELAMEMDKRDIANWTEVLFEDANGLPCGRGYETWVESPEGEPRELRIVSDAMGLVMGFVDRFHLCDCETAEDCAEFLADWAESGAGQTMRQKELRENDRY